MDGDEHKQSTMRGNEYIAITITASDLVMQQDYNLSYNLSITILRKWEQNTQQVFLACVS